MIGSASVFNIVINTVVYTVLEKALTALTSTAGLKSLSGGAWTMPLRYVDTTTDTLQLTQ